LELNTTRCMSCGKEIPIAAERPVFCPFCGIRLGEDFPAEVQPRDGESGLRALYTDLIRLYEEYDRKKADAAKPNSLSNTLRSLFTNYKGEQEEIGTAFYESLQSLTKMLAGECEALCVREEERPVSAEISRDAVRYILLDAANGKERETDLFLMAVESAAEVLIPFLSDQDLSDIRSEYRRGQPRSRDFPIQKDVRRALENETAKRAR
jgi:hypothetical protein